jgi:hypothetical protein
MTYPRICVAGIEVETGIHIRPIVGRQDILEYNMVGQDQLFRLGRIIDLGWCIQRGQPPEVEDVFFKPRNAVLVQDLLVNEFWQRLEEVAESSLEAIFGNELQSIGRTFALGQGEGRASLGELRSKGVRLELRHSDDGPKLRARFECPGLVTVPSVPVTDLRFFTQSNGSYIVQTELVDRINGRLESEDHVILSVGLSRAWSASSEGEPMHWLQINSIHLESDPLWK